VGTITVPCLLAGAGESLPDFPPGATVGSTSPIVVYFDRTANPTYFNLKCEISVGGVIYWTDSTKRTVTGIGKEEALPVRYALEQNYPNPFNPSTTINFSLMKTSNVELTVYNILGQRVATLVNGQLNAGVHVVKFNAANYASGVYFYRLEAGEFVAHKKMMLLK